MDSFSLINNNYFDKYDILFFKRIYNYYYHQGFSNIVLLNIHSLLIKYFLIIFIVFLTLYVDYEAVYNFNKEKEVYLYEFIKFNNNNIFNNTYLLICLIFYFIYLICCTINTITLIQNAYKTKKIINNDLGIKDKHFKYLSWPELVDIIIKSHNNPNFNIYTINSKICLDDNIIIDYFRSKMFNMKHISLILEWNFIFCFIQSLFNKENKITKETLLNYKKKVISRLKLIFIINIIALPFSIFIVLIYNIINYGETIYNNPEFFIKRIWSIKSKWRLKYYNELPHEFENRLNSISNDIDKIYFNNVDKGISLTLKFINFILSSVFITIIILSIINEKILFYCYIYKGRTIIWILGILGTVILIIKKMNVIKIISKEDKVQILKNLKQKLSGINPDWFTLNMYKKMNNLLSKMYQSKLKFIILEIIYVILAPYYIYKWQKEFEKSNFDVTKYIEKHYILSYISKKSIFTNYNLLKQDPHMMASYIEFVKNNPDWQKMSIHFKEYSDIENTFDWQENQNINILSESQILNSSYIIPNNTNNTNINNNMN